MSSNDMAMVRPSDNLSQSEDYESLVQSIYDLIQEAGFSMRDQMIRMKYEVGRLIAESDCYERYQWGAAKIIKSVAGDLDTNPRDIYDCLQFYFRCYDYDLAKGIEHRGPDPWLGSLQGMGKHVSWNWVRKRLPESTRAPKATRKGKGSYRNAMGFARAREGKTWTTLDTNGLAETLGVVSEESKTAVEIDPELDVVRGPTKDDDWV